MSEEDKTKSRLNKARAAKVDQDPTPAAASGAGAEQAPMPPLPPVVIEFGTLDEITNAISTA